MHYYFVTGTDTEIGKTFTTCALLHAARAAGLESVGYKPIAAGAEEFDGVWSNEDARRLRAASTPGYTLGQINPVCLREAVAPHIAAAAEGVALDVPPLVAGFEALAARADCVLVEGVGGFRVPLDERLDTSDLALALHLPVILVVGMRLGCINHALLTAEAITARGLPLAGWVANTLSPTMSRFDENLAALESRLAAPLLGVLPYCEAGPAALADRVRLPGTV
ncbi:dethiobiotin synthase [Niveibacterium umoris]|uniref:ATP-dependent dethiobiotin synthetase BioD n=1 Tax=Niveibacterium umoris TaxID=1193620 RepID=A0A840BNV1_9RHOO|nr:dethiobiotin synthase [Niveibacterium umoris]MBB4012137.1 dethiobiotin synthetase [Niveibacterium umoris]